MEKMRVWWIPQVGGGCPTFYVPVETIEEAAKTLNMLADYDNFQLENRIKPDFSNAGGLQVFDEGSQDWEEWELDCELGYFEDVLDYFEALEEAEEA